MHSSTLAYLGFGALVMVTGCGAPEETNSRDSQDVGEITSALCTDAGAANVSAPLGSSPGSLVTGTSPSRTYGTPACQSRFVVEATNTAGKSFNMYATWGEGLPATQQSCPLALVDADFYGRKNGQWTLIGHQSAGGVWINFFGGGFCTVGAAMSQTNSQYDRVRVAAKASAFALFFVDPRKVTATIDIPSVPR